MFRRWAPASENPISTVGWVTTYSSPLRRSLPTTVYQRRIGAVDDLGLVEVSVPGLGRQRVGPLLLEHLAPRRVGQQRLAGLEVGLVEGLGAGAELLHHRDLHAVDPQLERQGQRLPAH